MIAKHKTLFKRQQLQIGKEMDEMNLTLENETACDCQGEWIVLENAINGIIVPVFAILGLGGNIVVILAYR